MNPIIPVLIHTSAHPTSIPKRLTVTDGNVFFFRHVTDGYILIHC
jgi:hypothetical protein